MSTLSENSSKRALHSAGADNKDDISIRLSTWAADREESSDKEKFFTHALSADRIDVMISPTTHGCFQPDDLGLLIHINTWMTLAIISRIEMHVINNSRGNKGAKEN